jgi:enoyl-CoA hydratase
MTQRGRYELADGTATIAMDDGKANALSFAMFDELDAAFERAEADHAGVILTGRDGVLSGGFDLKTLGAGGADAARLVRTGFELVARVFAFPLPVVIACNGHAVAMGAFLALAGEYRIATQGPFKIGANEVAIGLTMPQFAAILCRERLSPTHYHRAVALSEMFDPDGAVSAGFFDRVVPAGELAATATTVMAQLQRLNRAAHAATKARIRLDALTRLRAAIEADDIELRARL